MPESELKLCQERAELETTVAENARLDVNWQNPRDDDLYRSGFMLRNDGDAPLTNSKSGSQGWCRLNCTPITIILVLILIVVSLPLLDYYAAKKHNNATNSNYDSGIACMDGCKLTLVESIPIGMIYPNSSVTHPKFYDTWMNLITSAQSSIEIACYYWKMRGEDSFSNPSIKEGENVLQALLEAGRDNGIRLRFIHNTETQKYANDDTKYLAKKGHAEVRSLDFPKLFGAGIFHSKFWLIDRSHILMSSANMSWQTFMQVKEIGLLATNCSCLATDLAKLFDVYWKLAEDGKVPTIWPESSSTKINDTNPLTYTRNNNKYSAFISSSPPQLTPTGRTNDIDAILNCIHKAEQFVYVSVTNYFPITHYEEKIRYWPIIDDALRTVAIENKVRVKLLISWWYHSKPSQDYFLASLTALTNSYPNVNIEVRMFIVPTISGPSKIPLERHNHHKFMVTDSALWIGSSNWSGDYFRNVSGIGMVFEDVGHKSQESLRHQFEEIFNRDWNSQYAHPFNETYRRGKRCIRRHRIFRDEN